MSKELLGARRARAGPDSHSSSKSRRPLLGRHPRSPVPVDYAVMGAAQKLDERFPEPLWISGELADVRQARFGRWFGTLTGTNSRVQIHVPPDVASQGPIPETGAAVLVQGTLSIWERGGEFRIDAVGAPVTVDSEGSRAAVRKATEKVLRAEGIFDSPKRGIPPWPRSVAVVSSPRGAAVGDVRNVIRRRAPWVSIELHECVVQGPAAPSAIVNALLAAGQSDADLVILTRGGGAKDRFDAFDDPVVVRQVARSRIPIIVAVGHQRDHTLADFAADLSAPTPSAAAERAVPDGVQLAKHAKVLAKRVNAGLRERLTAARRDTGHTESRVTRSIHHKVTATRIHMERFDSRIGRSMRQQLTAAERELEHARNRTEKRTRGFLRSTRSSLLQLDPGSSHSRMGQLVTQQLTRADQLLGRSVRAMRRHVELQRSRQESLTLGALFDRLKRTAASDRYRVTRLWRSARALSPAHLLSIGYVMAIGPASITVKSVKELSSGIELELVFEDGTATAVVQKIDSEHTTRRTP